VALVAALLVPGLGHVALGRRRLGAAFFAIVAATWGMGLVLGGRLPEAHSGAPLSYIGLAAGWGTGLLSLAARAAGLGQGDLRGATLEYGTTFLLCASVMNLLLVLDAFERARGRKP
jgi:hypothetical protein